MAFAGNHPAAEAPVFGAVLVGSSFGITSDNFSRVDAGRWTLDVRASIRPDYWEVKEICVFLLPRAREQLPADCALYVCIAPARGAQPREGRRARPTAECLVDRADIPRGVCSLPSAHASKGHLRLGRRLRVRVPRRRLGGVPVRRAAAGVVAGPTGGGLRGQTGISIEPLASLAGKEDSRLELFSPVHPERGRRCSRRACFSSVRVVSWPLPTVVLEVLSRTDGGAPGGFIPDMSVLPRVSVRASAVEKADQACFFLG